jgi:hypothetical protein
MLVRSRQSQPAPPEMGKCGGGAGQPRTGSVSSFRREDLPCATHETCQPSRRRELQRRDLAGNARDRARCEGAAPRTVLPRLFPENEDDVNICEHCGQRVGQPGGCDGISWSFREVEALPGETCFSGGDDNDSVCGAPAAVTLIGRVEVTPADSTAGLAASDETRFALCGHHAALARAEMTAQGLATRGTGAACVPAPAKRPRPPWRGPTRAPPAGVSVALKGVGLAWPCG